MIYQNVLEMIGNTPMIKINKISDKIKSGNIVTIFPDRGEKYLSTTLFDE